MKIPRTFREISGKILTSASLHPCVKATTNPPINADKLLKVSPARSEIASCTSCVSDANLVFMEPEISVKIR